MYKAITKLKQSSTFFAFTFSLFTLVSTTSTAKEALLLTGQIKAADNQTFYAPKTDNWQVQLQWMIPEGDIAKKGDFVVVFDSGNIQTTIEQNEVSLIAAQEELHRINSDNGQKLLEAIYAEKRKALLLQKARIDSSISVKHLSRYDFEKHQLELERAVVSHAKATEELKQVKTANQVAITKQKLTIENVQYKLQYDLQRLDKMSIYAQRSGPVLYGTHPWNGEKVFVGMTAQHSWEIAEIPSMKELYIEAWVHEVDYKYIKLDNLAKLKFDAFPTYNFTAKLIEVSTQPEERKVWGNDVYYRTRFEFKTDENITLLPGMSAQLELAGADFE